MKIIAVIVTYNRLNLLKRCLQAVINQTQNPAEIVVINNGSTDETQSWLDCQPVTCYTQDNQGGAGGFSTGIKVAFEHGADWIWVMDDDTIPNIDALAKLNEALTGLSEQQQKIGFLASNIHWTDGSLHHMNRTYTLTEKKKIEQINWMGIPSLRYIQFGTFVSLLIAAEAVSKVGLPLKEYFIWNDDVEYTKRIINAGLAGFAVAESRAVHGTPENHKSSVFEDGPGNLWKYRYGMRNELFTKKLHEGKLQFWISWLHRMLIMPFRILIGRKNNRWPFIKIIWQTSIAALSFRPVIEQVSR